MLKSLPGTNNQKFLMFLMLLFLRVNDLSAVLVLNSEGFSVYVMLFVLSSFFCLLYFESIDADWKKTTFFFVSLSLSMSFSGGVWLVFAELQPLRYLYLLKVFFFSGNVMGLYSTYDSFLHPNIYFQNMWKKNIACGYCWID